MTAKDFGRIALALSEAEERSHMNHPDFRVESRHEAEPTTFVLPDLCS